MKANFTNSKIAGRNYPLERIRKENEDMKNIIFTLNIEKDKIAIEKNNIALKLKENEFLFYKIKQKLQNLKDKIEEEKGANNIYFKELENILKDFPEDNVLSKFNIFENKNEENGQSEDINFSTPKNKINDNDNPPIDKRKKKKPVKKNPNVNINKFELTMYDKIRSEKILKIDNRVLYLPKTIANNDINISSEYYTIANKQFDLDKYNNLICYSDIMFEDLKNKKNIYIDITGKKSIELLEKIEKSDDMNKSLGSCTICSGFNKKAKQLLRIMNMTELINHCKNNHKSQLFKCIIQYEYDSEESIEILAGENDMLFLIEKENLEKNDLEDFNNLFEQIE